jgi:hypothetical protein
VAVVQVAYWSKTTGLRLGPAEAMIGPASIDGRSGSGELLLDANGLRSIMDALDHAQGLLHEINHTSGAQ